MCHLLPFSVGFFFNFGIDTTVLGDFPQCYVIIVDTKQVHLLVWYSASIFNFRWITALWYANGSDDGHANDDDGDNEMFTNERNFPLIDVTPDPLGSNYIIQTIHKGINSI